MRICIHRPIVLFTNSRRSWLRILIALYGSSFVSFDKVSLNPKRTVTELKELREFTGDENGAQRVAFTPTWAKARAWLRRKLEEFGPEIHADEAGNLSIRSRTAAGSMATEIFDVSASVLLTALLRR